MSEKCSKHSGASMSVCPYCKIEELKTEVARLKIMIKLMQTPSAERVTKTI